ncbi:MAG TPA: efflux RND transporter periplasmic adaptor subunit [Spirochaetia bacterium]|nr:efflux RND transporter periplasmic adaptor subunit [Spirochaetia bacterium]
MSNYEGERRRKGSGRSTAVKTLVLIILAVAAAFVWFALKPAVPAQQAQETLPVETVRPTIGDLAQTITLDSYVSSDSVVTVIPKVTGTLIALDADVGTHLMPGSIVARIDPEPYQIALNQAKAAFDGANSLYERQKQLYASGATSQQNFDSAQTQYENAKSQYELAKLQLSYTTITSPVEGTVVQRHVASGSLVSPSVPIVTISNTHALVVKADVPEGLARSFEADRASMVITASIPAMGAHVYPLRIRNIAPAIDVRSKTFSVECEIQGDSAGIIPGMFTQVTFVLAQKNGIPYLPYTVLVGSNTLWYIDSKGTAQFVTFTPDFHNDTYFELPEKLRDYTFILAGQHFLSAGAPVKAIGAPQAGK